VFAKNHLEKNQSISCPLPRHFFAPFAETTTVGCLFYVFVVVVVVRGRRELSRGWAERRLTPAYDTVGRANGTPRGPVTRGRRRRRVLPADIVIVVVIVVRRVIPRA